MIRLHYSPGTAAMAPHILMEEIGVPFELVLVDTAQGAHRTPAYRKLNPNGLVPALVDGDLVMHESAAICLHLCDSHPQAGLAPDAGTAERAHFYKWLVWLTNTLQATLAVYFYPERWTGDGSRERAAELKAQAQARVGPLLELLDAGLADQGRSCLEPWLLGKHYSAVDAYALMLCRWTRNFDSGPARELPHLGPYLQRALARPAVQRVFKTEGLAQPWV